MFPNLSYFLYYFTGIAPDGALSSFRTYGFFLVIGIVSGMFLFKHELRRKERSGMFGNHALQDENGYAGIFTQVFLNVQMIVTIFFAFIGAKVFSLLDKIPEFFESPIETIQSTGTAAYGGIIFGFFTSYFYFKRKNVSMLPLLDCMGPTLLFSNAVVRLGCYFSGDGCWGIAAGEKPNWWILPDWSWQSYYAHNISQKGKLIDGCTFHYNHILETPVFPTSLYESAILFAMFAFLWSIRKRAFNPGLLFALFLMLNGTERFLIEYIRVTNKYSIAGISITQAQIVALILFTIGLIWTILTIKKQGPLQTSNSAETTGSQNF